MTRKDTCADNTPKLDRRIVKTKRAIKEAFHRLIAEQGFGTFSITTLAQEADIDRKTFYLHYASIDDLVQEEAVDLVNRITCALSQPHDELTTARPLNTGAVLRELAQLVEEDCMHPLSAAFLLDVGRADGARAARPRHGRGTR